MIKKSLSFVLASLFFISFSSNADKLDGLMGPSIFINRHLSNSEEGTRNLYKFEFTRLSKNFGIDVRMGSGEGYTDIGGSLRLFKHIELNNIETATGVTFGGGAGGMWASLDSVDVVTGEKNEQSDVIIHAFSRYIYDFGNNLGLGVELEYQFVPFSSFRYGDPRQITEKRHRLLLGLNLLFDLGL